ncbi:MAG: phosphomethylpyrimidine synthase [Spirochaetes bacterium GWF1_51_8]|nr:MAG: phosphomethylpyrimidine synthase [Spirochaetes bacterium GWF1_51_8]
MTQIEAAKKGILTPEIKWVAEKEDIDANTLLESVAFGHAVILKNNIHNIKPVGVGKGLTTKVNANIGTSPDRMDLELELAKLKLAEDFGSDTVMDLSLGAILNNVRKRILEQSKIPLGTVPIYQVGFELSKQKRHMSEMRIDDFLGVIESQAKEGVDFMTVHSGITRKAWEYVRTGGRILDVVSRGGSMLCVWMEVNNDENPIYTYYDRILEIAYRYDVTLSLGDGMRPGATADASDRAQIEELITLGDLGRRAREANVQVMIEGPGHVPLDQVETNIRLQKTLCDGAPFYILGPLVTDIAPGYDHIAGAIGGAIAGAAGADFLCYLTPAEHLCLPDLSDVREGVIASKIAAHAADMVKLGKKARERDNKMSRARKKLDWDEMYRLAIDPEKARDRRESSGIADKDYCSMCGEFCAVKSLNEIQNKK